MTRIQWNKAGERFFEVGVDRGVLYPWVGNGVPWNGLVAVNESVAGGDMEALYFDGVKYLDVAAAEDFQASLEAYSAPREFDASDGQKALSPGLFVTQQPRRTFGLCYRTLIGNDLVGADFGYKLHLVYNCTAAPSGRSNKTIAGATSPDTRTWGIYTVPPPATTYRPTAHIVVDSTKVTEAKMTALENELYGTASIAPHQPTIAQIVAILS